MGKKRSKRGENKKKVQTLDNSRFHPTNLTISQVILFILLWVVIDKNQLFGFPSQQKTNKYG